MRRINKNIEPIALTEWRAKYQNDINFGYKLLRSDVNASKAIIDSLLKEQGWLCAYTGIRISEEKCHIEHIKAQYHCSPAETVSYNNMLACYPKPNHVPEPKFGARKKGDWPSPQESFLFVSPLDATCENRFIFNLQGEIFHQAEADNAAKTTIKKLGLCDSELSKLRRGAVQGLLGKENNLPIQNARKRLTRLKAQNSGHLEEFCFVLIQALEKHIKRVENIAKSKRAKK